MNGRYSHTLLIAVCLGLSASLTGKGQTILGFEPESATFGDPVNIQVSGLDPQATYTVKVGALTAEIESINESGFTILIPQDAVTAPVEISTLSGETTVSSSFPFAVTHTIPVRMDENLPVNPGQFRAASYYEINSLNHTGGAVRTVRGRASVIVAAHHSGHPMFLAIATGKDEALEFSARSTIAALVYSTGLFFSDDPDQAEERLSEIEAMAAMETAAVILHENLESGSDFFNDPQFGQAMGAVVTELLGFYEQKAANGLRSPAEDRYQQLSSHQTTGFDRDHFQEDVVKGIWDFSEGTPYDLPEPEDFAFFNTLNTEAGELNQTEAGVPVRIVNFNPPRNEELNLVRPNPLDWLVNVYELDPGQFPFGKPQVLTLSDDGYDRVFDRLRPDPIARVHVAAHGGATDNIIKPLTIAGWYDEAVKYVSDAMFPPEEAQKLAIPLDRPGIYLLRAYSGSLFVPQNELIKQIPGGVENKVQMLALNVMQILLQGGGASIGAFNVFDGKDVADVSYNAFKEALTTLTRKEVEKGIEASDVLWLATALGRALISHRAGKITEAIGGEGVSTFLRIQTAMLDAASADERLRGLISGSDCTLQACPNLTSIQTVETSVILVGDPFSPTITNFEPRSGYRGQLVTITGTGFSPVAENNLVEFYQASTTSPVPAPVIDATENRLTVVVPDEADTGAHPFTIKVIVDESTMGTLRGSADTTSLQAPFDEFIVIEDPVITAVEPSPIIVGSPFRIIGENFPEDLHQVFASYEDNFGSFNLTVLRANSPNEILVRATTFPLETDLTVSALNFATSQIPEVQEIAERVSDPFPISIVPGTGQQGWSFQVNSLGDFVAPDDKVTLREAMIWASGSGSIHSPTEDEQFFISIGEPARPVGEGVADTIFLPTSLGDSQADPITLASGLPPVTANDRIFLNGRELVGNGVQGNGMTVSGLSIPAENIDIHGLRLTGFQGNGLVLDNASLCRFEGVFVSNCTGTGILLQNGSSKNNFIRAQADGCGGHGVHLTGQNTADNSFTFNFEAFTNELLDGSTNDNDGWGVLVDQGANGNSLETGESIGNGMGGIGILDTNSVNNVIGRQIALAQQPFLQVLDNTGGPGIHVEASNTVIRYVQVAGNGGDGILLNGAITNCRIDAVRIGFDLEDNVRQNLGSGIHLMGGVSDSTIGVKVLPFLNRPPRNVIGGNRDHGIFLENATDIRINHTNVGTSSWFQTPATNGGHGIYLLNSSNCVIGHHEFDHHVSIIGTPNGAGIRLEGNDTFGNRIFGTTLGATREFQFFNPWYFEDTNQYGIHITGGAHSNVIGRRGTRRQIPELNNYLTIMISDVEIYGSSEAGILIESGLDPRATITANDVPSGGNVVQNCFIGSSFNTRQFGNRVGIALRGDARGNRIGGNDPSELNSIYGNRQVGIHIDGVRIPQANLANRIIGNLVRQNFETDKWMTLPEGFPDEPPDGGTGLGILVTDSANQPIGGTGPGERNVIGQTGVGIYVDNSETIRISGNQVGSAISFQQFMGNLHAGIVLNETENCVIGPDNFFLGNGSLIELTDTLTGSAAITDVFGRRNRILGNWIGVTPDGEDVIGNQSGIVLIDTEETIVGGPGLSNANTVVASKQDGIVIQGQFAWDNFIAGNRIGFYPGDTGGLGDPLPNGKSGIAVRDGARFNEIGRVPVVRGGQRQLVNSGNRIYTNTEAGIRVKGGETRYNTITRNSITGNAGPGIETSSGGNKELPPPEISGYSNGYVSGVVDEESVPDGSMVEVFTDFQNEGEIFKARGPVTDGQFRIFLGGTIYDNLTATVTDPDGNTSAFGLLPDLINTGFNLSRSHGPVLERRILANVESATAGVFSASSLNGIVQVHSVQFKVSGSLDDAANLDSISLYLDADWDGRVSGGDRLLGGPQAVEAEDPTLQLDLDNAVVDSLRPQQWLLVIELPESASAGDTLAFSVGSALDISVETVFPKGVLAVPIGPFPVKSDDLAFIAGDDPYYLWIQENFPPEFREDPSITAPSANPDIDSLSNLMERTFGTNPLVPNDSPLTVEFSPAMASFRFPWVKSVTDAEWHIETSLDATVWSMESGSVTVEPGEAIDRILTEIQAPVGGNGSWFARLVIELTAF